VKQDPEYEDVMNERTEQSVAQSPKAYVHVDECGVMRVGTSRVMLDSIVASFEHGYSAETIQQQYPALSLEEVYGAIAWYLAHTEEVTQYLRRQQAVWDQWRAKAAEQPSPVIQRLRALQARKA
jgi:uncharacterized protein (DUF433 family)